FFFLLLVMITQPSIASLSPYTTLFRSVMSRFHELLATGQTPASALALASAQTGITVFTCFGAGDRPLVPDSGRSADTQPRTRQGHSQQPMSQPRRVPCRGQPVATGLDESVTHSDQEPT